MKKRHTETEKLPQTSIGKITFRKEFRGNYRI